MVVIVSWIGAIVRLNGCVAETGPSCPPEASVTFTVKLMVPAAVGVPEMAPAVLRDSPAGSADPLARLQLSVPVPPVAARVALYAVPTVPPVRVVVVIFGAGATITAAADDFEVSAREVACIDTVMFAETVLGALYVAPDVVLPVNVPQAAPVHDVPDILQLTPALPESFVTFALKLSVWPASIPVCADGEIATEITFLLPPPPLPHPHKNRTTDITIKTDFFMTWLPRAIWISGAPRQTSHRNGACSKVCNCGRRFGYDR